MYEVGFVRAGKFLPLSEFFPAAVRERQMSDVEREECKQHPERPRGKFKRAIFELLEDAQEQVRLLTKRHLSNENGGKDKRAGKPYFAGGEFAVRKLKSARELEKEREEGVNYASVSDAVKEFASDINWHAQSAKPSEIVTGTMAGETVDTESVPESVVRETAREALAETLGNAGEVKRGPGRPPKLKE